MCDEKAAAAGALGTYAEETGAAFGPYLEHSLECLLSMGAYFHEAVRAQAFEGLPRLLSAATAAFPAASAGALHQLRATGLVSISSHLMRASCGDTVSGSRRPIVAGFLCVGPCSASIWHS